MSIQIVVQPRKPERLNDILIDLITSSSFFGKKNIDFKKIGKGFSFKFPGYCPKEYLFYLSKRYELFLDLVE